MDGKGSVWEYLGKNDASKYVEKTSKRMVETGEEASVHRKHASIPIKFLLGTKNTFFHPLFKTPLSLPSRNGIKLDFDRRILRHGNSIGKKRIAVRPGENESVTQHAKVVRRFLSLV